RVARAKLHTRNSEYLASGTGNRRSDQRDRRLEGSDELQIADKPPSWWFSSALKRFEGAQSRPPFYWLVRTRIREFALDEAIQVDVEFLKAISTMTRERRIPSFGAASPSKRRRRGSIAKGNKQSGRTRGLLKSSGRIAIALEHEQTTKPVMARSLTKRKGYPAPMWSNSRAYGTRICSHPGLEFCVRYAHSGGWS
ncbi:hypothetical protein LTR60_002186, partial [Cryomyces antarcticus]